MGAKIVKYHSKSSNVYTPKICTSERNCVFIIVCFLAITIYETSACFVEPTV